MDQGEDRFHWKINYGLFSTFSTDLKKAFAEVYNEPVARRELFKLKQTGMSAIDYTTRFRLLAAQGNLKSSGVKNATDNIILRDLYKDGLNAPLRKEVENKKDAPESWAEWITRAIAHDQQWRLNNPKTISVLPKTNVKKISLPRNPSTTISRLTDAERRQLMKEGRCFFCKVQGHMSRDCLKPKPAYNRPSQGTIPQTHQSPLNRTNNPPSYQKKEEPKKWEPKKFDTYIRQMLNNMTNQDFDTFHEAWTSSPFERSTNRESSLPQDFPTGD
ncbi:hypothetical protein H1R20_g11564, partial [Candolleomyces eurysporus]